MHKDIQKLRLKFYFIASGIAFLIIVVFCAFILISAYNDGQARTEMFINDHPNDYRFNAEIRDNNNKMFASLFLHIVLIGGVSTLILLVLIWFLIARVIKPTEKSFEKQQRFISEASHELKTPLAIIATGAELMQKEKSKEKQQKYLNDIISQTQRMAKMTSDMLTLSQLDETAKPPKEKFNLSQTILTEVLSFETLAFENKKEIKNQIDDNVFYHGNRNDVISAIAILLNNAIKYGNENSTINVSLANNVLSVSNTGAKLKQDELPFIFERFYRGSEERGHIAGTGLGLSILKNLADINKWKLSTNLDGDKITFVINF